VILWLVSVAQAADPQFGIGGHVGTWFLPAAYPYTFPKAIRNYDFDNKDEDNADDVDGDGEPDATTLSGARADVGVGVDAYTWLSRSTRFGITSHAALAPGFQDLSALFVLDYTAPLGDAQAFIGGGIGFGSTSWQGADKDERLWVPSYPARVESGMTFLLGDTFATELRLIGQILIPSRHVYTDIAGQEQDVSAWPLTYGAVGLQLGFLFGEFD
jgi:hypothetical protein